MKDMKLVIESNKNALLNSKKRKELFEVYEWSNMIGELYESICNMINREKNERSDCEWFVLKEYSKCYCI